jgi:DNA (cytosine-5)-methyltransferase 1
MSKVWIRMVAARVASFFCGCGGSSLGYRNAGYKVVIACDWEKNAIETYKLNFPKTLTLLADIRDVNYSKFHKLTGINKGELEILDGSPPCTPFSMAGKREKYWGKSHTSTFDTKAQVSDDLFMEYIRLIDELQPKVFIAENVDALIRGNAKGYFNIIIQGMRKVGYNVTAMKLDAADLGVPQHRRRIIFIGIRNDIKVNKAAKLLKRRHISFIEAVSGIDIKESELMIARRLHSRKNIALAHAAKQGESLGKYHPRGSYYTEAKLKANEPSRTITAHVGVDLIHPTEYRILTVPEVKRLCTFPDNFKFLSRNDAYVRMGNSVPPLMMQRIAEYVTSMLDNNT